VDFGPLTGAPSQLGNQFLTQPHRWSVSRGVHFQAVWKRYSR